MKVKKILLTIIASIFIACISMFTLTACEVAKPHTHDWGEWQIVTPANCLTQGKEQRVCKGDASHKEERPIAKTGHSGFVLCTTCGEFLANEQEASFYGTALDSLVSAKSFGLVVEDVEFSYEEIRDWSYDDDYDGIPDGYYHYEDSLSFTADFAEVVVGCKEEVGVFAYGVGEVTLVGEGLPVAPVKAIAYFENNVGYFRLETSGMEDMFVKVDVTEVMQQLEAKLTKQNVADMIDAYLPMIKEEAPVEIHGALDSFAEWLKGDPVGDINGFINQNNQIIKNIFASSIVKAVKKVPANGGYEISFDYDILCELNNDLYSKTIEDWLEESYGMNPLAKIRGKINDFLALTVGDIITKVETELDTTLSEVLDSIWVALDLPAEIEGLTKQDIINTISSSTIKNTSLGSLLQDILTTYYGQGASLTEMIDFAFEGLEECLSYTVYELMFGTTLEPEINGGFSGYAAAPSQSDMLLQLKDTINQVIGILEDLCNFVLHTDSQGNVKKITYCIDYDMNELASQLGLDPQGVKIEAKGQMSLIVDYKEQSTEQLQEFKAEAQSFFNKVDLSSETILQQLKAHYGEDNVVIEDGRYKINYQEVEIYPTEENDWIDNQTYYYENVYVYNYTYEFSEDFDLQSMIQVVYSDCDNVVELGLLCDYNVECEYSYYYVRKDASGNEVVRELRDSSGWYVENGFDVLVLFGYNVEDQTLVFYEDYNDVGHNYEIDASKTTIVNGWQKICLKCSKCGKEVYEYWEPQD